MTPTAPLSVRGCVEIKVTSNRGQHWLPHSLLCRRYQFLFKEKLPEELRALKAELKRARTSAEQLRIQQRISKVQQSIKRNEHKGLEDQVCILQTG